MKEREQMESKFKRVREEGGCILQESEVLGLSGPTQESYMNLLHLTTKVNHPPSHLLSLIDQKSNHWGVNPSALASGHPAT